jgi:hypothetical protein
MQRYFLQLVAWRLRPSTLWMRLFYGARVKATECGLAVDFLVKDAMTL